MVMCVYIYIYTHICFTGYMGLIYDYTKPFLLGNIWLFLKNSPGDRNPKL